MSKKEYFRFANPLDIVIGKGRIIWGDALVYTPEKGHYMKGQIFSEGWVLPGGERTQDRNRAEAAARAINGAKS